MSKDLVVELRCQNKDLKQKLQESKRELNEFKRAVKEANSAGGRSGKGAGVLDSLLKSIGLNAGKAGSSMTLLGGGLGKLAGFFGVAMGAAEMFNATINSSNQLGDEMERIQTQAGSAVNYFGSCLANVDFSNFWQGLQNAITASGKLADILDRVNTELQGLGVRTSERGLKIAQLEGEAAKLARSDPKRQQIYDQIKKLQEEDIKETQALAKDMREGAVQRVVSAAGLSDAEAKKYMPQIEDLIRNKSDKEIEQITKAYEKYNKAKNAKSGSSFNTTGTGMFNTKDVANYSKELSEAEKELKKLGVSQREAQALSKIFDVSDNKEDSPLTKARKEMSQSYNMETQAQTKLNGLVARETMLRERMSKAEKSKLKAAEAAAKKTYTENAKTEFALKANITALTELRDKTDPLAPSWKAYNDEIVETQRKLDRIDLSKLAGNTFAKMKAELQLLNTELENTAIKSEKFNQIQQNIKKLEKGIQDAQFATTDWTDTTKLGLEAQKKALEDLIGTLEPDMVDAIKAINDQIEAIDKQLEAFSPQPIAGSIDAIDKQISDLSKEYTRTGDSDKRLKITAQIAKLEYDKSVMENAANSKLVWQPSFQQTQNMAASDMARQSASDLQGAVSLGVIGYEDAKAKLQEINDELVKLGLEPIDVKIVSTGAEKTAKTLSNIADVLGSVGNAFGSLGQLAEDPTLDVMGIIAGAVANIMLGYAQASSSPAVTSTGWGWIAFAAAGLAEALAAAASIKSATSGYASGGVVGGNSYHGDALYARVNSGEMILNSRQQRNLFNAIDEGRIGGVGGSSEVSFVLRGSDLYGSLKNYGAMKAKAGKTIKIG